MRWPGLPVTCRPGRRCRCWPGCCSPAPTRADDLRVRLRGFGRGSGPRRNSLSRKRFGVRSVVVRHHPGVAGQAGRCQRRRHPGVVDLWQRPVLAADHGRRGLSGAAGAAGGNRCHLGRSVRRGDRPGRGGRRARRHVADAHRHPGRDFRRDSGFGRHRPVPAGGARADLVDVVSRHRGRGAGAGEDAGRSCQGRYFRLRGGSGAGRRPAVGKEGLLGIRSAGKRTTTRLLDAEFPKFRQLLPTEHTAVATIGRRRADRCDQACGAGRRPWRAGPDGVQRRHSAPVRRCRRRRPRGGGPARGLLGRAADHRLQPDLPDRRSGIAALRPGDVRVHHAEPTRGVAAGDGSAGSGDAARSRRCRRTTYIC